MPRGVPVGTVAIGGAGAHNAGLLAAQILAYNDPELRKRLIRRRERVRKTVLEAELP
jgi:5-(carboxyamino)imidazole ribonucleotide mutase